MSEKDIEKELKSSADKITVKSFSERRNGINDKLTSAEDMKIPVESPSLATNGNNTVADFVNKKRNLLIAILSTILCIIVILAIVLPITLRKDEPAFFDSSELMVIALNDDKERFFAAIGEAGYEIIDVSGFEVEDFALKVTIDGHKVKGGFLSASDGERGFVCDVEFYDISVSLEYDDLKDYTSYTAGSTEIKYKTEYDGSIYLVAAITQYKDVKYRLNYFSVEDNCTDFFDEIFS